ncbi:MAG: response regulator [Dehalococcoidia bacterium]|nr:response regulator [Dehalococcoidia bacterium]
MCRVARALFEGEGFQVVTTQDAASALSWLGTDGAPQPDVILLDLHMPGMTGSTFAREYRARTAAPAPLVVLSADVVASLDELPWAAERLVKPVDVDRMLDAVRRQLPPR